MHLCKFTLIIILQRSVNDDFFCCCCWLITTPCSTSIQGTPLFKRHLPWSQGCLLNGARYSTITILRRQKVHCRKTKKYIYSYCKTQQRLQKNHISPDRSIDQSLNPTGCIPDIILRLCGFLCIRHAGCRGKKINQNLFLFLSKVPAINGPVFVYIVKFQKHPYPNPQRAILL